MASIHQAEVRPHARREATLGTIIDRWIYVLMAVFFIAIVLTAFVPDSIAKVAMVQAGKRPPFPLVMHLHSLLMGSFLLLLLVQTSLGATGRIGWHRQVGTVAVFLVPALVVVGLMLSFTIYHESVVLAQTAGPSTRGQALASVLRKENILLNQLRMSLLFPLFMVLALRARRRDPGFHKRMVILATASALFPAFARLNWLPSDFPRSNVTQELYVAATILPMLAWDLVRGDGFHRAYRLWFAVSAPIAIATYFLWDTPFWHATARTILGA